MGRERGERPQWPHSTELALSGSRPHLLAGLDGDVLRKDLLGLGDHLGLGFDLLVLLACQPELQVLLTELSLQESTESSQPICKGCKGASARGAAEAWAALLEAPQASLASGINAVPLHTAHTLHKEGRINTGKKSLSATDSEVPKPGAHLHGQIASDVLQ